MIGDQPVYPVPLDDSCYYGISNRDHIAVEAMKALISRIPINWPLDPMGIAHQAYGMADLMLAESRKGR